MIDRISFHFLFLVLVTFYVYITVWIFYFKTEFILGLNNDKKT